MPRRKHVKTRAVKDEAEHCEHDAAARWLRDNEPRSWGKVGLTQVNPTDQPRDDAAD
jgi:hypothetical protein